MTDKPKARRGFAAMTPEKRREIAAMGGRSLKPEVRSFAADRELAARAGALGGQASHGGGRPKKAEAAE